MSLDDFLDNCNPPRMGALWEVVFGYKMKELGHQVERVRTADGAQRDGWGNILEKQELMPFALRQNRFPVTMPSILCNG